MEVITEAAARLRQQQRSMDYGDDPQASTDILQDHASAARAKVVHFSARRETVLTTTTTSTSNTNHDIRDTTPTAIFSEDEKENTPD